MKEQEEFKRFFLQCGALSGLNHVRHENNIQEVRTSLQNCCSQELLSGYAGKAFFIKGALPFEEGWVLWPLEGVAWLVKDRFFTMIELFIWDSGEKPLYFDSCHDVIHLSSSCISHKYLCDNNLYREKVKKDHERWLVDVCLFLMNLWKVRADVHGSFREGNLFCPSSWEFLSRRYTFIHQKIQTWETYAISQKHLW